jgi:Response regulator containing a CheY-like receiver domain and an HD-GYP domain
MKYVVLLTGNNRMAINEFFTYMDNSLECINTSSRYDDIMNHLKYISPDVFVYCLYGESPDDIKRFDNVEQRITEQGIPIIIVGNREECEQFTKIVPTTQATFFQRPISAQKLEHSIVELLEKQGEKKSAAGAANAGGGTDINKAAPSMPAELPKPPARKHILIVDDDSSVLKLLKGYLAERYDVATAINGKVAMKFLETKRTDMVLLDYEMPEENGAAVLRKIRENSKTRNLPVVFLTGITERGKIQEVLALKIQGYLLKPIDMEKVSSTIKGVLGRR